MSIAFITSAISQEISNLISIMLNIPVHAMFAQQRPNRKLQILASATLQVDEIFILSSIFCSSRINDTLLEVLFLINTCKLKSKAKLTLSTTYLYAFIFNNICSDAVFSVFKAG